MGKYALYIDYSDGEKTGLAEEGLVSALVDVESSVRAETVEDPEVAVSDGVGRWEEASVERDFGLLEGEVGCGHCQGGGSSVVVGGVVGTGVGLGGHGGWGPAGLDVLDDLDDVAWVGGAGDDGCYAG